MTSNILSVSNFYGQELLWANYRAACRGRSRAEFSAKLGICEEECDEVMYWLEIMAETETDNSDERQKLWKEAEELLKIFVSSINTSKGVVKPNVQSAISNPK